jgi:hypothetical protein
LSTAGCVETLINTGIFAIPGLAGYAGFSPCYRPKLTWDRKISTNLPLKSIFKVKRKTPSKIRIKPRFPCLRFFHFSLNTGDIFEKK